MTGARIYPPSEQRIAEARRAGHVPRTSLVGLAGALSGLALGLFLVGGRIAAACSGLLVSVLGAEERLRAGLAVQLVTEICSALMWLLACAGLGALIFGALGQGIALRVPFSRPRRPFPRSAAPRTTKFLAAFAVVGVGAAALSEGMTATPASLVELLFRFLVHVAAVFCACALVDAALARTGYFRSLWLSRREHLDEQREAYGSPEIRAARARLRNESRQRAS